MLRAKVITVNFVLMDQRQFETEMLESKSRKINKEEIKAVLLGIFLEILGCLEFGMHDGNIFPIHIPILNYSFQRLEQTLKLKEKEMVSDGEVNTFDLAVKVLEMMM